VSTCRRPLDRIVYNVDHCVMQRRAADYAVLVPSGGVEGGSYGVNVGNKPIDRG